MRPSSPLARLATDHGDWCVQFPAHGYIKCYAVLSGECWIAVEGGEPVALTVGDCVLLPGGRGFRLGSDLTLPATEVETYWRRKEARNALDTVSPGADVSSGVVPPGAGSNEVTFIGSAFTLPGPQAALLLGTLPPLIHLKSATGQEALRWSLERMEQELREERPGARLMAEHLAQLFLIQALRVYLDRAGPGQVGWLFALSDPALSGIIGALHADPAHLWTVQGLAKRAGVSRSTFAARFKAAVGMAPMEYLTKWRMLLATERLNGGEETVASIALSLGYESEAAFSTAFKRVMGVSPRRYGRQLHLMAAPAAAD
ncbi:AraC family transcriptional regulator [Deinococcus altitudinis]|uniref:AraC family transcriptional regulator n=1 Tax=Deinococcus altitudinis TaxID=468914 RepID=UPI003892940D